VTDNIFEVLNLKITIVCLRIT